MTLALLLACFNCFASNTADSLKTASLNENGEIIKKGLSFGPLPAVAFDADKGFQFGALLNIYNFGDGSSYPEPKSHWYIEGSAYMKNGGIGTQNYVVSYDNKRLTPNYNLRMCGAASLVKYTALEFLGFNGYQSVFNPEIESGFYRHARTTANFKVDFIGEIAPNLFWEGGYHFNHFKTGSYKDYEQESLFDLYQQWGIIPEDQVGNATSSAIRVGLMYDSRDVEAAPSRGIWAEAHLVAAPEFLGSSHGYSKFNITYRQYFPLVQNKLVLAYRLAYQGFLGEDAPWYVLPYYTVVGPLYDRDGIGGYRTTRGIMYNRVQGLHTAFFNAELRWRFVDFQLWNQNIAFALSGFCDGAMVTKDMDVTNRTGVKQDLYREFIDLSCSSSDTPHIALGGGLRFIMNHNFIVAMEYARSLRNQDNTKGAIYINTGFLF